MVEHTEPEQIELRTAVHTAFDQLESIVVPFNRASGSALAYVDWDILVRLFSGETVADDNFFTQSLYRSIMMYFNYLLRTAEHLGRADNADKHYRALSC